uniref:Uncharacterized protein n=1 Tax=Lactuca sativa TaxID=4236 RepID=A0A9R1X8N8_LACSA|nr:hypothetical protein LSAT_V11C600307700 [Lactuca sativa]
MDSHVSCRTPPLGLTTSINFNAADSDYRLPFHIQLRLLSNTSPTLATRLVNDDDDDKLKHDRHLFSILLCTVSLAAARLLYAQMAYVGNLSYTIPKFKVSYIIVEPHLCLYKSR